MDSLMPLLEYGCLHSIRQSGQSRGHLQPIDQLTAALEEFCASRRTPVALVLANS
jgi:hypothetical protein